MPLAVTRYYVFRAFGVWWAKSYHPRKGETRPPARRAAFASARTLDGIMDKLARRIARQHQRKTAQ